MERLIDDFVASLNRRDTTKETYRKALREFSRWAGGAKPEALGQDDIQRYKDYILSKNLSPTSMSAYLTAVRRFYDYLVSRDMTPENPARKIKGAARPEKHLTPPLTRGELERLLASADDPSPIGKRDLAILSLMALAGLSEIEIVRADLGDVVRKEGRTAVYVQGKNKDKKDEYVTLSAPASAALHDYIRARGGSRAGEPLFWGIGNRAVGGRITTRGVRARVNHYLDVSGLRGKGIKPLSLRHTAALLAIAEGATVSDIKRMMHLKTTESALVYFEEAKELLKE